MGLNQNQFLEHDDDVRFLESVPAENVPVSTLGFRSNLFLIHFVPFRVESQPFELHYQASSLRIESLSADFEFLAPNTAFSARTLHVT